MMNLDIKTIIILTAISALVISVSMFVTSINFPQIQGIRKWAYACGFHGLGWILIGLRGAVPDAVSIFLGNLLIIISAGLFFRSIAAFKTARAYTPFLNALTVVYALLFGYFSFIDPQFVMRSLLTSSAAGIIAVACGLLLIFSDKKRPSVSEWVMAIGFFAIAGAAATRFLDLLVHFDQENHDLFAPEFSHGLIFTLLFASILVLTYSFTLMINDRFMDQILRLATLDPLTEIYNRGAMETLVKKEIDRAKRYHLPMSFLILDLDHFKKVNDTYGHQVGDSTLKRIVDAASGALREHDIIARFGGEEFTVLLPDTDIKNGERVAERIRRMVESTEFESETEKFFVTISIGLATLDWKSDDFDSILRRADLGLYKAKQTGRNKTVAVKNRKVESRTDDDDDSIIFMSDPAMRIQLNMDSESIE